MSVEVKTPTRTQFEHHQFPCGDRNQTVSMESMSEHVQSSRKASDNNRDSAAANNHSCADVKHDRNQNVHQNQRPQFNRMESAPAGKCTRRRRFSERPPDHRHEKNNQFKRGRFNSRSGKLSQEKIVLPTKFLLGGNITDPLNLNSLCDEAVNKALNENTPQSSPLPLPSHRQQVHVLIPPNITDPLNLNSGEDVDMNLISPKSSGKKKRHHKYKKKRSLDGKSEDVQIGEEQECANRDLSKPMHIEIAAESDVASTVVSCMAADASAESRNQSLGNKLKKVVDKIVSPVIPQISPKSRRRKRTSSECWPEGSSVPKALLKEDSERSAKLDKSISPHKPKYRKQSSNQTTLQKKTYKPHSKEQKFIYGNYNRYYGYRNPDLEEDNRMKSFRLEWFEGRDVLDIGCNVGHVTLAVARDYRPHKIVGIDIDSHLIKAARNNVRNYMSSNLANTDKFPVSMAVCYGPIAAAPVPVNEMPVFPNNVTFVHGNYVLESDELLELQREEYDVILGLSLTKWIHLNFGDAGLKRAFKRMFRQLRPGGKLILEPQSWSSYKKKKKISETIFKNYQSIQLRPEQFTEYLLSREVGFSTCQLIDTPYNRAKGFRRAVQVFTKADTCHATPYPEPWSSCATPVFKNEESSSGAGAKFLIGSAGGTPNTPHGEIESRSSTPSGMEATSTNTTSQGSVSPGRPIEETKSFSAPSLLETVPFETQVVLTGTEQDSCPATQDVTSAGDTSNLNVDDHGGGERSLKK